MLVHIGHNVLAYRNVEIHRSWIFHAHILQHHELDDLPGMLGIAFDLYHDEPVSDLLIPLVVHCSCPECQTLLRLHLTRLEFSYQCTPYPLLKLGGDLLHCYTQLIAPSQVIYCNYCAGIHSISAVEQGLRRDISSKLVIIINQFASFANCIGLAATSRSHCKYMHTFGIGAAPNSSAEDQHLSQDLITKVHVLPGLIYELIRLATVYNLLCFHCNI
ncbi:MAG: hypothetical protein A4E47_00805 [Methanosaeta sp. PtaU1.Bin028]|nr:MAG: hypothetical protein A4E47_00805 [Methanosaeta sp. PtaU1.Bin028]